MTLSTVVALSLAGWLYVYFEVVSQTLSKTPLKLVAPSGLSSVSIARAWPRLIVANNGGIISDHRRTTERPLKIQV